MLDRIWNSIHVKGGHHGYEYTRKKISDEYRIENICDWVRNKIDNCEPCIRGVHVFVKHIFRNK